MRDYSTDRDGEQYQRVLAFVGLVEPTSGMLLARAGGAAAGIVTLVVITILGLVGTVGIIPVAILLLFVVVRGLHMYRQLRRSR